MRRIHIFDKSVSANSFFKKKPENTRPAIFPIITAYFIPLSGSLILKRIMKPTTESTSVAIVPMLASDIQNTSPHTTSAPTAITSVSPPGSAFSMTLVIKCPFILSLFCSSANKNPGTPMVNILMSDTCAGSSGYVTIRITENSESNSENIFFTRNRLAERWILFTTLRPSYTTSGICAKSESKRTTWAAWAAASLPDAIATLQSASFMASISLTPSPVIATV